MTARQRCIRVTSLVLFFLLLGRRVDAASCGRALAFSNLLMLLTLASAELISAYCFERQGSYQWALVLLAVGHLAAIGSLLASNRTSNGSAAST